MVGGEPGAALIGSDFRFGLDLAPGPARLAGWGGGGVLRQRGAYGVPKPTGPPRPHAVPSQGRITTKGRAGHIPVHSPSASWGPRRGRGVRTWVGITGDLGREIERWGVPGRAPRAAGPGLRRVGALTWASGGRTGGWTDGGARTARGAGASGLTAAWPRRLPGRNGVGAQSDRERKGGGGGGGGGGREGKRREGARAGGGAGGSREEEEEEEEGGSARRRLPSR